MKGRMQQTATFGSTHEGWPRSDRPSDNTDFTRGPDDQRAPLWKGAIH